VRKYPPFGAAYGRGFAAVAAAHNQVLCVAVLVGLGRRAEGFARIWLVATAVLDERDTGEGGQPVHQLVLESQVTGL
jgi:hypothetical protein